MRIVKLLITGAGVAAAAYATNVVLAWSRYGRSRAPAVAERDELLDRFVPRYEVCDRHAIGLAAPPDVAMAAARQLSLEGSRIVRAIFGARALILRSAPAAAPLAEGLLERMTSIGWGVLAETADEVVVGAATRPWEPDPVFRALAPADFASFSEPGYVKIAWTMRVVPAEDGGSIFRTETRAIATDPASREKFRWYWSFLSPGIALIRVGLLRTLAVAADRAWRLAGDEVLPDADAQLTHAIAIDARPAAVWPWLVQMGGQRGGWYSWDRLDNGGRRSADRIIPELQHLHLGDVLPWRPDAPEGFEVIRIEPESALVVRGGSPRFDGTWAFALEPLGATRTRLVTRYRAVFRPGAHPGLMKPMMAAVHGFMERKQLRTIKHHAEHAPDLRSEARAPTTGAAARPSVVET